MEFSESDFEASSIPDFALAGPLRHSTGPSTLSAPTRTSSDTEVQPAMKCSRRFAVELVAIPGGFRDLRSYLGIGLQIRSD
jgi:hypothetical protein